MDPIITLCLEGAELRTPDLDSPLPIDFVVFSEAATLVAEADWWRKRWDAGDNIQVIHALPEATKRAGIYTFRHGSKTLLTTASDADQAEYLTAVRLRTDLYRPLYLIQLQLLVNSEPSFDFNPWLEAVLSRPEIDLDAVNEGETGERPVGKILLLDGLATVVDTLVIDELGYAASLVPDGWLAPFAEQWANYAEGERPPLNEFVQWLAQQSPYGDRSLTEAGVISASGDIQDIALQLASR